MIVRCCIFFVLLALVLSRTVKDDVNHLLTKSGRVLIGVVQGNMEAVQLGINEGGSANAIMEPYFGDMVIRLGKAYVAFPSCPAVHLCLNYATKDHLNVAALLIKYGANINHYRLPVVSTNGTVDLLDRGYPPSLLFALGMGQVPQNSHAGMLQRMVRTNKNIFNFTTINQWREESGNPPLVQLCLLVGNVDGAHVLLSEFNMDVNEVDPDGVTALHIAAWHDNLPGMVMLLRQGAKVIAEDQFGRTPLHYVVMRGHSTTALKILLASAMSDTSRTAELQRSMLTHPDRSGKTVFDFAAATPLKTDLLKFLREQARLLGIAIPDGGSDSLEALVSATGDELEELANLEASVHDGGWFYPVNPVNPVEGAGAAESDSLRTIQLPSNLSLGVAVVDAEDLTANSFLVDYFSTQRPLLISGQLAAGAGIWAHWMRDDFLHRYGSVQVTVGPGAYAETRAALRYERLVATNTSFCTPIIDVQSSGASEIGCKTSRRSSYRKSMSVRDYVARCMSLPPSTQTTLPEQTLRSTTPRCSWDGHAAHASLQLPKDWRWDLPTPDLFDGLCRSPRAASAPIESADTPERHDPSSSKGGESAHRLLRVPHHVDEPVQLHLGGVHSGSPLQAHNASWNLLLAGKKKWFLLPPGALIDAERERFVCNETAPTSLPAGNTDAQRRRRGLGVDTIACVVTAQEWLLQTVPRLRETRQLVEVTQYQGDVLFIPHDWQYATLNLADTVSVTREMCTFRNSDARVQPLGSVIYGREDPHRGLGMYQLHRKSSTRVGIKLKTTSKVPQFDFRPVT